MILLFLPNVQALATLPAGASEETGVEVGSGEHRRRNSGLVGVAQPRLVRRIRFFCAGRRLTTSPTQETTPRTALV